MDIRLNTPLNRAKLAALRRGDTVLLTGEIFTARDAAHARMAKALAGGETLPFALENACTYYAGPTPARPGQAVGSIGPTTAGRMDKFTPALLDRGLAAMIGKGERSEAVVDAIRRNCAVYFGFLGGAGALAAACIEKAEIVAWEDLGSEAVRRLWVRDFPLTVIIDSRGGNLYREGPREYLAARQGEAGSE